MVRKKKCVVLTREDVDNKRLAELLNSELAEIRSVPCIKKTRLDIGCEDKTTIMAGISDKRTVFIFQSRSAVRFFAELLSEFNVNTSFRACCLADGTAEEYIRVFGRTPDMVANGRNAKDLADFISAKIPYDTRLIVIRSKVGLSHLVSSLTGRVVYPIDIYTTETDHSHKSELAFILSNYSKIAMVFLSPSAVKGMRDMLYKNGQDPSLLLHSKDLTTFALGATTRKSVNTLFPNSQVLTPTTPRLQALADLINEWLGTDYVINA